MSIFCSRDSIVIESIVLISGNAIAIVIFDNRTTSEVFKVKRSELDRRELRNYVIVQAYTLGASFTIKFQ